MKGLSAKVGLLLLTTMVVVHTDAYPSLSAEEENQLDETEIQVRDVTDNENRIVAQTEVEIAGDFKRGGGCGGKRNAKRGGGCGCGDKRDAAKRGGGCRKRGGGGCGCYRNRNRNRDRIGNNNRNGNGNLNNNLNGNLNNNMNGNFNGNFNNNMNGNNNGNNNRNSNGWLLF